MKRSFKYEHSKSTTRAQSIVIQNNCVLFVCGKGVHCFPGGGVELGETAEQGAIRELREEANVNGKILFRLKDDLFENQITFFADIGDQKPSLGYNPEDAGTGEANSLTGVELIPLTKTEAFTEIDIDYFKLLIAECGRRKISFSWLDDMKSLVRRKVQRLTS